MLYLFDLEADSNFRSFDLKSSGSMDKTWGQRVLFLEVEAFFGECEDRLPKTVPVSACAMAQKTRAAGQAHRSLSSCRV
ncbi:hypothetical protein [Mesorhizobium sp. B1-1-7]|uniref:hypothetical protein n=1 Tax=Mesorhizobium sp. B1-1-7 TaxID=2589977 RepID=UPI0015E407E7|nr:hypothetical protein [Mesorhizobium sp. B1-1-7]